MIIHIVSLMFISHIIIASLIICVYGEEKLFSEEKAKALHLSPYFWNSAAEV